MSEVATIALMRSQGVGVFTQAVAASTVDQLRAELDAALSQSLELAKSSAAEEASRFGAVLCRHCRFDLKLGLESSAVQDAVSELLHTHPTLRATLAALLGDDAELYELATMVSSPGAHRQPVHPDTPIEPIERSPVDGDGSGAAEALPAVCTAFLALQDISPEMGPTVLWAGTHTSAAHEAWYDEKVAFLRRSRARVGLLNKGDVLLFDSRLLHCGGANSAQSGSRRALFYFSFKARRARGVAPGTLLGALRGCHSLNTL